MYYVKTRVLMCLIVLFFLALLTLIPYMAQMTDVLLAILAMVGVFGKDFNNDVDKFHDALEDTFYGVRTKFQRPDKEW